MSKSKNEIEVLEVLPIGSEVSLKNSGKEQIVAIVNAVCVRSNNYVSYECAWFNGNTVSSGWFAKHELEPNKTGNDRMQIGFVSSNS